MSDSTKVDTAHRISRRSVVKGGLVVGGTLWAAPAVQILTATKASASTASGAGSGSAVSYVMLVLGDGNGNFFTLKVDQSASRSCMSLPDSGTSSGVVQSSSFTDNDAFGGYVLANAASWGNREQNSCSIDAVSASVSGGLVITVASGYTLLGYMVHDGSLKNDGGWKDRFAAGTTPPGGGPTPGASSDFPSGWTVTAPTGAAGGTYTFAKP